MQLAGLCDGVALLAGVNDEQRAGELLHVLDAAEVLLELGDLALVLDNFLLGKHCERAVLFHLLQLSQTVDTGAHGAEVGEHTAQPSCVDVVLTNALGLFLDGVLRLLLGADEQDAFAVGCQLTDEGISLFQLLHGLLKIDDVDAVALGVDVGCHFRIPAAGLMTEVHAGFQKLLHRYDCHLFYLLCLFFLHPDHLPWPPLCGTGHGIPGCVS